jgi:hypothetical protein
MEKKIIISISIFFLAVLMFSCSDIDLSEQDIETGANNQTTINDQTIIDDQTIINDQSEVRNKYTITWKDYYGNILEIDNNVEEGTIPVYNGTTPYLLPTSMYTYTFSGWSPKVGPAYGNTVYSPLFTLESRQESIFITNTDFEDYFTYELTTSIQILNNSAMYTIFLTVSPKPLVASWTSITIRITANIPYTYGIGNSSSWQSTLDFHKTFTPSNLSQQQSIVISAANVKIDTNPVYYYWKDNPIYWNIIGSAIIMK